MTYFCLMSDISYLAKALALYESIKNNISTDYLLFYYAFDEATFQILNNLNLPNIKPVFIEDIEGEVLLRLKSERSRAEYFFTCTPHIIEHAIKTYQLSHCIYLDSDIYFFDDPNLIFKELSYEKKVLITPHRFSKKYIKEEKYGIYCVQLLTFFNNTCCLKVLNDWKNNCIDWCYLKLEDKRYADQKYLNSWPENYSCVEVTNNLGFGLAPWNINRYELFASSKKVFIIEQNRKNNLLFYHFQNLRFYNNGFVDLRTSKLKKFEKSFIYVPYVKHLIKITEKYQQEFGNKNVLGIRMVTRTKIRYIILWLIGVLGQKQFNIFKYNYYRPEYLIETYNAQEKN